MKGKSNVPLISSFLDPKSGREWMVCEVADSLYRVVRSQLPGSPVWIYLTLWGTISPSLPGHSQIIERCSNKIREHEITVSLSGLDYSLITGLLF